MECITYYMLYHLTLKIILINLTLVIDFDFGQIIFILGAVKKKKKAFKGLVD